MSNGSISEIFRVENLETNQPHIGTIFKDPLEKSIMWTGIDIVGKGNWKKNEKLESSEGNWKD